MSGLGIAAVLGLSLLGGWVCAAMPPNRRDAQHEKSLVERIDGLLPQWQCGQCGFPGCRPYAEAIAHGRCGINRCPPGGSRTIALLAELLGTVPKGLDPALAPVASACTAHIDETVCIGCLKCVRACPVDAILGAAGQMHTVIPQFCTGCGLCVAPCPVDCIDLRTPAGAAIGRAA